MKYFSILLSMATLSSYALPTYLSSDPGLFISPSNNVQLGVGAYGSNEKDTLNGIFLGRGHGINIFGAGYYVMQSKVFSTHPIIGCSLSLHSSKQTDNQGAWNAVNSDFGITTHGDVSITHQKTNSYSISPIIGLQYPITNRLLVNFELNPVSFSYDKQNLQSSRSHVTRNKSFSYNHLHLRFLYQLV